MKHSESAEVQLALDHLIGESAWTMQTRKRIRQVANFRYSVLIAGPSGTGKELIAKAVHALGPRHESPFIPVNCAAIPSGLFSSQLFGHVKGAFTGANYASLGCFRAAQGGTIFLDEIGELDLDSQAKLLRVLQERVVTPVGSHSGETVDVRTVAATNRNLMAEVREGRFRLDLYYRLNVLAIETVGLQQRPEDMEALVNHFLAKTAVECGIELKQISPTALELLESYSWPGNVRELENFIDRAVIMTEGEVIGPDAFPDILEARPNRTIGMTSAWHPDESSTASPAIESLLPHPPSNGVAPLSVPNAGENGPWLTLAQIEKQHIRRTLQATFFNQSAAARMLDIDRKMLARKIKKYGLQIPSPPDR